MSYITDIPGWPEIYGDSGVLYCTEIKELAPQFRAILEPQGIKSMLQCAIMDNGVFRGYVGFDECRSNRLWTNEHISMLTFLADLLAVFLLKKRVQDRLEEQADNLRRVLDMHDEWVYVLDPQNGTLKFVNEKMRQFAPTVREGMICYRELMNRDTPCPDCPAAKLATADKAEKILENSKFGKKVHVTANKMTWDGKDSCLIISKEC